MSTEIEVKFTNVNVVSMRDQLKRTGASLIHSERLMRRCVFDFPDESLEKKGAWVRVRDEGNQITLSYKELQSRTLHGTVEYSVVVNDFEKTVELLLAIGLKQDAYQETKREEWQLNGCEVVIDTWPWIPSFVEIEGPAEELVRQTAKQLGFDWSQAHFGSVETVYLENYDVTEQEVDNWPEITFTTVPDWLEKKRKK